jgi:hypothetical protein
MRRRLPVALATAAAMLFLPATVRPAPPEASPVAVSASPWRFEALGRTSSDYLRYIAAIRLASDDPRFGGFSGLAVSADGRALLAVSDQSWWLKGELQYTDGALSGFTGARMAPLAGLDGRRPKQKRMQDAEALVALTSKGPAGPVAVAFERVPRVQRHPPGKDGFPGMPQAVRMPRDADAGPENEELEALGVLAAGPHLGRFIAISEGAFTGDGSAVKGWVFGGKGKPFGFAVKSDGSFRITDLTVLPGGDILLLERSFAAPSWLPGMSVRLVRAADIVPGAVIEPQPLYKAQVPRAMVDNMEGLAAFQTPQGETRLLVMSDDNYARDRQSTILVEFALTLPGP